MKYLKRILHAVLFFAGLYCLLLLSSQFFLPKNNTEEAGMEDLTANGFLAEKENSIDVLFLGDSEVHRSVIPMQIWKETGITSYDCSSDRQVLSYSFSLLKRAVDRQKPKIVFLLILLAVLWIADVLLQSLGLMPAAGSYFITGLTGGALIRAAFGAISSAVRKKAA